MVPCLKLVYGVLVSYLIHGSSYAPVLVAHSTRPCKFTRSSNFYPEAWPVQELIFRPREKTKKRLCHVLDLVRHLHGFWGAGMAEWLSKAMI